MNDMHKSVPTKIPDDFIRKWQRIVNLAAKILKVPAGLIMRLAAKDPMKRKMETDTSYWEPVEFEGVTGKSRYERQF